MNSTDKWTASDLEKWSEKIEKIASSFGLDWYPQEFEIVDYETMLGLMAYHGIPSYYPHWSFGKAYERQATLYEYDFAGLPYELVINTNPCAAYLMNENSLALQILTMAHVYAHNNFFKNNTNFSRGTRAELALEFFHASAERIRSYGADPSIGQEKVEKLLDAAHALMWHCSQVPGIGYVSQKEKKQKILAGVNESHTDRWGHLKEKEKTEPPDLNKLPIKPEENFLLFIRDHSPRKFEDWEVDILTIAAETLDYFKPQILTKIMNEGWASYWHDRIIRSLGLPADLLLEINQSHSAVICPPDNPLTINPYFVGIKVWQDIFRKYEEPTDEEKERYAIKGGEGAKQIFHVMRTGNDSSFLRAYLTKELMTDLFFLKYGASGDQFIVDELVEENNWKKIRNLLARDVGLGLVPDIRIKDADHNGSRSAYLVHNFDGRHLDKEYAKRALEHFYYLWGRPVVLETTTYRRRSPYIYQYDGKSHSQNRKK